MTKIKNVAFEQIDGTKKFLHGVDSEVKYSNGIEEIKRHDNCIRVFEN